MIMPRPLSGCQIKAEIQGFLLMYRLFQYQQWFFQDIERRWIPEMTSAPCTSLIFQRVGRSISKCKDNPHGAGLQLMVQVRNEHSFERTS